MSTENVQMPADTIYRELSKVVTRVQQQEQRSGVVIMESGVGHTTLKFQTPAAPAGSSAPAGGAASDVPANASTPDAGAGI
jgi:hypothetical protein